MQNGTILERLISAKKEVNSDTKEKTKIYIYRI